jgi:peptidyl-prolyl cis-trans isomerase SurA
VKTFVQNIDASSVILKSGIFTENNELLPSEYTLAKGISKIYEVNGKFIFVKSDEVVLAKQQEFKKIKGKVISDYQDYLEKEWIQDLRENYTVHINDSVVEAIISKHSKL